MSRAKSVVSKHSYVQVDDSQSVTITLPFPPKELSPNARTNRWVKARIVSHYRQDCGWLGRAWLNEHPRWQGFQGLVEATVTFVVPDKRRRDEQNFLQMLKPAFDGLVDAGVLTDDNHEVFRVVATSFEVGEPKVIVSLSTSNLRADSVSPNTESSTSVSRGGGT